MWCLGRILPLILGECVPQNDPYWENYLLMLTITDYLFAPVTSHDIATYVKHLIQEHHEAFCVLYPHASFIPKLHIMIHLPEWMQRYVMFLYAFCQNTQPNISSPESAIIPCLSHSCL